jgi:glucose-specific phosphotransferase system IIA component
MAGLGSRAFSILQKVGQSLMIPVSVLPAAGLLVALGRIVQDATTHNSEITNLLFNSLGKLMFSGGLAIFEQLPVVFAIGVAIGFTSGAGVAALASVVGYFTMTNVLKVMTEVRALELEINTGVFGGIIIGLISASLYNRFFKTKLPAVLGFFAGKRLVPILTAVAAIVAGVVLGMIWPPIQAAINEFGANIMESQFGPAFYAAGKRLLIPVGLHHVYYSPFLFEFGQFTTEAGKILTGESARYFAGDPTAGKFMASEFPIMLFGLPAACFAMYLRAPKLKRKAVGGIMLSAALTSIITGITEPIEFAFIFVAPLLYIFHVLAAFCSGLLTNYFDVHLGYTFSASAIDYIVGYFNQKNGSMIFFVIGPMIGALYFSVFYWLIGLFDFKTPGREDEVESNIEVGSQSEKAQLVLKALGTASNIEHIDACITRLRVSVHSQDNVDKDSLKALGAAGVMQTGNNLQVIFGTESDALKDEIKMVMASGETSTIKQEFNISSPMTGRVLSLTDVPDATFAQKILGDGIAIDPTSGVVTAPVKGEIVQLFHTNHAIGLKTEEGAEILIHIGIDTVKMKGEGFKAHVKVGDQVNMGDKLIDFDLELVKEKAKSNITPIVFTNMDMISKLTFTDSNQVKSKDGLINIEMK